MTSPFLRICYMAIYYDNLLGMYAAVHYDNKVCGQSGLRVPRSPGSGILVPCRHGQIFVAAQGCHRHQCQGILLNSWHSRNSWGLFHLGCWCCRCSRCGLHVWCRWGWCRLCCYGVGSCQSLWHGSCTTWDSVSCFDTAFMEVSPCMVVCGTIAGVYLVAVPW